jgi:small lipoprotein (TIGR04454 family)
MHKTAIAAAIVLVASLASACGGGKASKEQCDKVVDHMVDIATKGMSPEIKKTAAEAARGKMAEQMSKCTEQLTQAQFDCIMKADSLGAVMKCE